MLDGTEKIVDHMSFVLAEGTIYKLPRSKRINILAYTNSVATQHIQECARFSSLPLFHSANYPPTGRWTLSIS